MQCLMPLLFCLPGLPGQPDIGRQLSVIVHAYMLLCIHTKLHGHGHCRYDWTVTGEMLPMVKIRVPRPKEPTLFMAGMYMCVSHWRRGTFARGSQCTSRDRILGACRAGLSWRKCTSTVWAMSCHCNIKDLGVFKTQYLCVPLWREDQSRFLEMPFCVIIIIEIMDHG